MASSATKNLFSQQRVLLSLKKGVAESLQKQGKWMQLLWVIARGSRSSAGSSQVPRSCPPTWPLRVTGCTLGY